MENLLSLFPMKLISVSLSLEHKIAKHFFPMKRLKVQVPYRMIGINSSENTCTLGMILLLRRISQWHVSKTNN